MNLYREEIEFPEDIRPLITVVIHTEEEFDWDAGFKRENTEIDHIKNIQVVQDIFEKHAILPLYTVDYAVASQKSKAQSLFDLCVSGRAEIGTHLHPWINPPLKEELSDYNSFACNLETDIEYEKLDVLSRQIEDAFHVRPTSYLAGRYGTGEHTASHLKKLGYMLDFSVSPSFDYSDIDGPDFRGFSNKPMWLDKERTLLGLPHTSSYTGHLHALSDEVERITSWPIAKALRLRGILSRLKLLNRLRLTPEGYDLDELKALTRFLYKTGTRHFVFSFHSSSIKPGCTPYVTSGKQLERFLRLCDDYFEYFFSEFDGENLNTVTTYRRIKSYSVV